MMVESRIASVAGVQPAASDDDKAKAEAEAVAAVQSHPNKGQFVQYLGPTNAVAAAEELKTRQPKLGEGTLAEITAAQWGQVGVAAKRGHQWDLSNEWRVPATDFSQEQLDYLAAHSKRFVLVDGEGQKVKAEQ
jgi:hypothetical protein